MTGGKHDSMKQWDPEEDQLILALLQQLGPKWSQIVRQLPGRTVSSVRNRWQRIDKGRKLREAGLESKNRCQQCGEPKRGHVCMVKLAQLRKQGNKLDPTQAAIAAANEAAGAAAAAIGLSGVGARLRIDSGASEIWGGAADGALFPPSPGSRRPRKRGASDASDRAGSRLRRMSDMGAPPALERQSSPSLDACIAAAAAAHAAASAEEEGLASAFGGAGGSPTQSSSLASIPEHGGCSLLGSAARAHASRLLPPPCSLGGGSARLLEARPRSPPLGAPLLEQVPSGQRICNELGFEALVAAATAPSGEVLTSGLVTDLDRQFSGGAPLLPDAQPGERRMSDASAHRIAEGKAYSPLSACSPLSARAAAELRPLPLQQKLSLGTFAAPFRSAAALPAGHPLPATHPLAGLPRAPSGEFIVDGGAPPAAPPPASPEATNAEILHKVLACGGGSVGHAAAVAAMGPAAGSRPRADSSIASAACEAVAYSMELLAAGAPVPTPLPAASASAADEADDVDMAVLAAEAARSRATSLDMAAMEAARSRAASLDMALLADEAAGAARAAVCAPAGGAVALGGAFDPTRKANLEADDASAAASSAASSDAACAAPISPLTTSAVPAEW